MIPATVHLAAQWIRHQRGLCTAVEKWIACLPPSPASRELSEIIALYRANLRTVEVKIASIDVDAPHVPKPHTLRESPEVGTTGNGGEPPPE